MVSSQGEARAGGGSERIQTGVNLWKLVRNTAPRTAVVRPQARHELVMPGPEDAGYYVRNQRWDRIKVKEKQLSRTKHKGLQYLHMSLKKEKSGKKTTLLGAGISQRINSQVESYKRAIFLSF